MFSESVRMISKRSWSSSVRRYRVPPSALVIVFIAIRMFSSRRLMSRSLDSDMPISLSWSRRASSSPSGPGVPSVPMASVSPAFQSRVLSSSMGSPGSLLDANGAYLRHVGRAHQHLLDAVHFQRTHAVGERGGEHRPPPLPLLDV